MGFRYNLMYDELHLFLSWATEFAMWNTLHLVMCITFLIRNRTYVLLDGILYSLGLYTINTASHALRFITQLEVKAATYIQSHLLSLQ